jgi:diguanylate cyclase (GGDEF)-like protein
MMSSVDQDSETEQLLAENERLRAEVNRLEQKVAELDELAHQDSLIALPNRRGFIRQLDQVVERVNRQGDSAAMLFVDLDGLKMINDSFGHQAGDEALIEVATMLVGGVRRSDCVARIGGDEFGILLEHASEATARETTARLVDLIASCDFTHDGDALPLSVAIGYAMIRPSDDAPSVMARADSEMYKRKATRA